MSERASAELPVSCSGDRYSNVPIRGARQLGRDTQLGLREGDVERIVAPFGRRTTELRTAELLGVCRYPAERADRHRLPILPGDGVAAFVNQHAGKGYVVKVVEYPPGRGH